MIRTISLLAFTILCITFVPINAQNGCVPIMVVNITLSPDSILNWAVSPNETCTIDHFIINVQVPSGYELDTLITSSTSANVSHIHFCTRLLFTVTAVTAEHMTGYTEYYFGVIPMPPDTDLSIAYINYTQIDDHVRLDWELTNSSNNICVDYFRIRIEIPGRAPINRTALYETIDIRDLIPCGNYQFSIYAVRIGRPEIDGPTRNVTYTESARVIDPPTLVNVTYGSTFFNSYWTFNYTSNVCNATSLRVDGSPYFNNTYPVLDPLAPSTLVNVTYLNPNSLYAFRIRAENSAGLSSPIHVAIQTLPRNSDI